MLILNDKYSLGLTINNATKINSKNHIYPIEFTADHIRKINKAYHEDFIDGGYKIINPRDV